MAIRYLGNNGSLPPPHRRSTEIVIDASGRGMLRRVRGYDSGEPGQRFEMAFQLDLEPLECFARSMLELGVIGLHWRQMARPPVGGPVVSVQLTMGKKCVEVPPFPVARQQALAAQLRSAVLELVPESIWAACSQWQQGD